MGAVFRRAEEIQEVDVDRLMVPVKDTKFGELCTDTGDIRCRDVHLTNIENISHRKRLKRFVRIDVMPGNQFDDIFVRVKK